MYKTDNNKERENYITLIDAIKQNSYKNLCYEENKKNIFNEFFKKLKRALKKLISRDSLIDINGKNNLKDLKVNYFSTERIAVYTCIIGNYDKLVEPVFYPDNCDFYAITNFNIPNKSKWRRIDPQRYLPDVNLSNVEINRYFKILPYLIFPKYKYSVYIDGNVKMATDPTEFVNRISKDGMAFFRHSERFSVYREADACIALKKANKKDVEEWINFLKKQKMPENYGLVQCSVIARDHSSQIMRKVMKEWWNLFYNTKVKRDQLLLPYVLMKNNISVDDVCTLGGNVWTYPGLQTVEHN